MENDGQKKEASVNQRIQKLRGEKKLARGRSANRSDQSGSRASSLGKRERTKASNRSTPTPMG